MFRASTLLALALLAAAAPGCAWTKKKISPKHTYRAAYYASADGVSFHPLHKLMDLAENAKPACRGMDRKIQVNAHYFVTRTDSSIGIRIQRCESSPENCAKLEQCLKLRPVAWITRATGRTEQHAGLIYTDWIGRCGGTIAVRFYFGPHNQLPLERVGCAEPAHDPVDASHEMYVISRPDIEGLPAAGPFVERLLEKWNHTVFHEIDSLPTAMTRQ